MQQDLLLDLYYLAKSSCDIKPIFSHTFQDFWGIFCYTCKQFLKNLNTFPVWPVLAKPAKLLMYVWLTLAALSNF